MRRYSDRETAVPCCGEKSEQDRRYTQESGYGDRSRSHQELKDSQIRKPSLSEGLALREKINRY